MTDVDSPDFIAEQIQRSRDREDGATFGPWQASTHSDARWCGVIALKFNHTIAVLEDAGEDAILNFEFIAAARTMEPRFRDALEYAVQILKIDRRYGDIEKVERMLRGRI